MLRRRPSPSMVVACLALFVALGGVGYAAATIGSGDIKNNSVRGKDIRDRTITGKDVRESTLDEVPSAEDADELGGDGVNQFLRYGRPIPSGETVIGVWACRSEDDEGAFGCQEGVSLPAPAPNRLGRDAVNFEADHGLGHFAAVDAQGTCTGSVAVPTAPPGAACVYLASATSPGEGELLYGEVNGSGGGTPENDTAGGFVVEVNGQAGDLPQNVAATGTWAYTAP